jgi:dihydrofolate synthase / folylpolyglutamate synthase
MTLDFKPETLDDWLKYLERLHPQAIAMGLERVWRLKQALALDPGYPIITVGGTNGKGSCCAMLEAVLLHAGYRVGCYTSPHLLRYNERVRIGGRTANDDELCRAFERVESARVDMAGGTRLTYFEFGTLAAMLAFAEANIEVAILEVGLGGRLDAVNVFDNDCALVASVDLDHQGYLGDTRDAIGFEKAGIFRGGRPAICADTNPPASLVARAAEIRAKLMLINHDFGYVAATGEWSYWGRGGKRYGLPYPALRGAYQLANAAACITALDCLRESLPVTAQDIHSGLLQAKLAGRFEVLPGRPTVILDVAHNPHAARALAANLASMPRSANTFAVFAMLKDKDIAGVVNAVKDRIESWFVATTEGPRGATAQQLAEELNLAGVATAVGQFKDVAGAWRAARDIAAGNDKIIAFGSFLTVAAVMRERQRADAGATDAT